jgi:hypothetical protein
MMQHQDECRCSSTSAPEIELILFCEAWVSAQAAAELGRLPRELADRLTKPFANFLRIEAAAGVVLLSFAVAAVI